MSGFRPFTDTWICARPKVKYFGAYPAGFLLRARDLLNVGHHDQVLHVCSGRVRDYKCSPGCKGQPTSGRAPLHYHGWGYNDVTWDLDATLKPDIVSDVRHTKSWLEVASAHPQIQAVLADPPYDPIFAGHYSVGPDVLPSPSTIVHHAILDCLPIGGRVGVLSMEWPRYPKNNARQIAVVHVLVGNGNLGRTFAVYERTA